VDAIAPPVFAAAGDRYYKVAAEAMRVCSALVPILRPGGAAVPVAPGARTHVVVLVDAALARVAAADQDQEVKEAAITCVGVAAAALGDAMGDRLDKVLGLLLERLGNEITRLAAIKAITLVAQSSLLPDLAAVAPAIVKELATFLRKANRPLRQASLTALDALVVHHAAALRDPDAVALVSEAASLVSDSDMALASLALALSASVVRCAGFPDAAAQVCALVLPAALGLVRSPLMQKQALSSLQAFFAALVSAKLPGASFEALLSSLMDPKKTFGGGGGAGGEDSGAAATGAVAVGRSAAKCVAAVCASVGPAATASTVATLIAELETPRQGGGGREDLLALLCLGELGRRADLSSSGAAADGLEKVLLAAFDSPGEELKSAASFALGGVAAGNQVRHAVCP
jgi:cullin-associated NEDD8-dissociated protein 1